MLLALSLAQLSDLAQILSGLGVLLIVYEIWRGVQHSRVEVITGLTTLITQIDRAFIDYPMMLKYFEDGESPDGADVDRARAVALTMANILDHVVEHLHLLDSGTEKAWSAYIGQVHSQSPILERVLTEHPHWWPGLRRHLREHRLQTATATGARPACGSP